MKRWLGLAVAVSSSVFGVRSADAHFILEAPACWMSQDSAGVPEKAPPCGNEGGGTPSNVVTAFQEGQTITITVEEVVFHPGHYRVALGLTGQGDLPAEPPVTAGSTACGTTTVESPPVFPVLADNVFEHTAPFSAPQTTTIKLPDGVTCTSCVLQVIEFMSDHGLNNPGGCFYHHCANVMISASSPDGGTDDDDGGTSTSSASSSSVSGAGGSTAVSGSSSGSDGAGGAASSSTGSFVSSSTGTGAGATETHGSSSGCAYASTDGSNQGDGRVVANLAALMGAALLVGRGRRSKRAGHASK